MVYRKQNVARLRLLQNVNRTHLHFMRPPTEIALLTAPRLSVCLSVRGGSVMPYASVTAQFNYILC